MKNVRVHISYDGKAYSGWQRLTGSSAKTLQGTIEKVISDITQEKIEIIGAGRTDKGVHALCQVANFHTESEMSASALMEKLNEKLPSDIRITDADIVEERFHARFHAKTKTYLYKIRNTPIHDPFSYDYSYHIAEPLDLNLMRQAGSAFIGTHNFQAFTNLKEKKKSFDRTITDIQIRKDGSFVEIYITADGLLYNQARIMASSLIEAGLGKLTKSEIADLIEKKDRSLVSGAAPAFALYLVSIAYDE